MKTIPTYIFILFINILTAQTLKFFCKVPKEELGGTEQAGILQKIVADSQYIYLVGQQPNEIKGFKNTNILFFSKIDYSGHVEKASLVLDPSITLNPTDIDPLIKLTDTTYIIYLAYQDTTSSNTNFYLTLEELNFRRYTLKRKFIFSDTLMEQDIAFIPESKKINSGFLSYNFRFDPSPLPNKNRIYEFDANFEVKRSFIIPTDSEPSTGFHWMDKLNNGDYEFIGLRRKVVDQPLFEMFYLRLDSTGKIIKKKYLPTSRKIYIQPLFNYLVEKDNFGNFVMVCDEFNELISDYFGAPHFIKVSPEFDSIIWLTKFYEYPEIVENPKYYTYDITRMNQSTDYIACGSIYTQSFSQADYSTIFKVSDRGDSLWFRKYYPIGWDTLRATQSRFNQIVSTPYNTIAAAGYIGDIGSGWVHPFVVHVDSNGCLVPGCGQFVRTEDIKKGIENAFVIYPNPIVGDIIYILAHVTAEEDYHIQIADLYGRIIKSTKFRPTQQVQYMLPIEESIPSGEYILKISGADYMQSEKLVVE